MNHRIWSVRCEHDNVRRGCRTRRCRENIRIRRRTRCGRPRSNHRHDLELELSRRYTSVRDRIRDRGIDNPPIVNPIATADHGLAPAGQVPRKSCARAEVVLVAGEPRRCGQQSVGNLRIGQFFVVPAQAQVECETRQDAPVILRKQSIVESCELKSRRPKALVEVGVARNGNGGAARGSSGAGRLWEIVDSGHVIADEIHPFAVGVCAAFLK